MELESTLRPNKKNTGLFAISLIGLILIILALLAVNFRQQILDYFWYNAYSPSAEVASLADRAGMNESGKYLFFASRPTLDGTQTFNELCGRQETTASILGCYSDYKIYLYNITDEKLDGIREVTVAHETLHAVYIRMGADEKKRVDALLEVEYSKIKNNKEISELVSYFAKTEPGQRDNELHSIIGTKIASVSPELEAHYDKYFSDRTKTLKLNEKYSAVFQQISDQASKLAAELNTLSNKISNESSQYNSDLNDLNAAIASFNQLANTGGFTSQAQFNAQRNSLMSRVSALAADRATVNSDISTFNEKLTEYNSLATESKKLYDSIDSSLAPAPSL